MDAPPPIASPWGAWVSLALVFTLALVVAFGRCASPDPEPPRAPLAVADSALAAEGTRAVATRDEALTRADSLAAVALDLSAETAARLAALDRRHASLHAELSALYRDLPALPPDSLARRASALCRARRRSC